MSFAQRSELFGKIGLFARTHDHRRFDDPWHDCVNPDVEGAIVDGRSLGQPDHPMLGSDIVRGSGNRYRAQGRSGVHDGATATVQHGPDLMLHAVENTGQVDADNAIPRRR
ncbi:hypothetical protein D3C87_1438870 [compost metagenome]